MSWLAVLLVGIGVADLAHTVRPTPVVNECVGAFVAVWFGLLLGLTDLADLLALAVVAGLVVAWGQSVTRAFGGGRPWVPLTVLGGSVALGVLLSPVAGPVDGLAAAWLDRVGVPVLQHLSPDRAALLLGAVLVQLSSGNVVVRLVLAATHTPQPADELSPEGDEERLDSEVSLKGGRLLGPMERLFILGLGLAGQWTAASIVVAAKGLLRWPELRSTANQVTVHRLTEYFLVGSFVSWMVALGALVLLAT